VNFAVLPLALQRRLLKQFAERQGLALDFEHVEKLRRCANGELTKAELPGGWLAVRKGEHLELRALQPEQSCPNYEYALSIPGELCIPEIGATIRATLVKPEFAREAEPGSLLSADLVGPEVIIRNWRPGDRFWPAHSAAEEKLKRLFAEKRIPAEQRSTWPVALCGEQIVWVRGFPVARSFAWSGSGGAVSIEFLKA
jgi:tRNA(Ile)-lysidine synthase